MISLTGQVTGELFFSIVLAPCVFQKPEELRGGGITSPASSAHAIARFLSGVASYGGARGEVPRPSGEGVGGCDCEAQGRGEKGCGERRVQTKQEALDGAAKGGLRRSPHRSAVERVRCRLTAPALVLIAQTNRLRGGFP